MFVGTVLYGYCDGFFGRDSYEPKRIEGIGADWVVVREEDGTPNFARFESNLQMLAKIPIWSIKPKEEER